MNKESAKTLYSYHTFIFPFTWEINNKARSDRFSFLKKVFNQNERWQCTDLENIDSYLQNTNNNIDIRKELYKSYQYFYPHVRKTIWGSSGTICSDFELKLPDADESPSYYKITKDEKEYILIIHSIKVRIVNTGVALFIMECRYYRDENAKGSLIEDVKNINDYGRRITLPFLDSATLITADKLEVEIPEITKGTGKFVFAEDYKAFTDDYISNKNSGLSPDHVTGFIKELMSGNKYRFTSHKPANEKQIHITPILDDRMYVAFAVSDKKYVEDISSSAGGFNEDLSKSLYELAYLDHSGGCSCPDAGMRNKLNDRAIYRRWLPYGTLYTLTEMGCGMVTGEKTDSFLFDNFQTCYLEMVLIVLTQRVSIVRFTSETAAIAESFSADKQSLNEKSIKKIQTLQEQCSAFDSQLRFTAVSSEQQASEMYAMLRDVFELDEEFKGLEGKLSRLYEIANTDLDMMINSRVNFLTWESIILAFGALIYSMVGVSDVIIKDETGSVSALGRIIGLNNGMWVLWAVIMASLILFVSNTLNSKKRR